MRGSDMKEVDISGITSEQYAKDGWRCADWKDISGLVAQINNALHDSETGLRLVVGNRSDDNWHIRIVKAGTQVKAYKSEEKK